MHTMQYASVSFNHALFLQFLFLIHSCVTLLSPSSLTDRITSYPTIHSGFVLSPALLPPSGIVFFALRNRMEIIESEEVSMHHNYLLAHSDSSAFQLYVNRPSTSIYSNVKDKVLPAGQYL